MIAELIFFTLSVFVIKKYCRKSDLVKENDTRITESVVRLAKAIKID